MESHKTRANQIITTKYTLFIGLILSSSGMYAGYTDIIKKSFGGIELRAGVDPVIFSDRGPAFEIVEVINPQEGRLDKLYDGFKFSDIFSTPWIVAGQFNWCFSECHKTFLEFNYTHAFGETIVRDASLRSAQGEVVLKNQLDFGDFAMFGAYIGHRFYTSVFSRLSFFGGSKIGLGHYRDIGLAIQDADTPTPTFQVSGTAYEKQTVVSGGLQIGLDFCFTDCFSMTVQAEALGSGSLSPTINSFVFDPGVSLVQGTNIIIGKTGTLVSFPVTIGFSWDW